MTPKLINSGRVVGVGMQWETYHSQPTAMYGSHVGLCGQDGLSLRVPYGLTFWVPKKFWPLCQAGSHVGCPAGCYIGCPAGSNVGCSALIRLVIKKNVFTLLAWVIIYVRLHCTDFTGIYHLLIT